MQQPQHQHRNRSFSKQIKFYPSHVLPVSTVWKSILYFSPFSSLIWLINTTEERNEKKCDFNCCIMLYSAKSWNLKAETKTWITSGYGFAWPEQWICPPVLLENSILYAGSWTKIGPCKSNDVESACVCSSQAYMSTIRLIYKWMNNREVEREWEGDT